MSERKYVVIGVFALSRGNVKRVSRKAVFSE